MNMLPDARDLARMVTIRAVLRDFGWRVRGRRADCGLCRGNSTGTLAFTERVWKCHRCNAGGDAFSLVRAANRCQFPDALRYVANLAGVRLGDFRGTDVRREVAARKQQRERVDSAVDKWEALERALRLECRDRIHLAERRLVVLSDAPDWTESDWLTASVCWDSLRRDLPAYTLLSWGALRERTRYLLHANERGEMAAAVHWAGGVHAGDGHYIEVPL